MLVKTEGTPGRSAGGVHGRRTSLNKPFRSALGALAALVLAATPCGAVAADDGAIRVTVGTTELIDESADLSADWYLNALEARFGIRFDIYSSNADIDGLTDLWIQSGDIPDVLAGGINIGLYRQYARQGLLGFFPDGWETDYPNLYADVAATGILDRCQLDGKTFVAPRVIMSPLMDLPLDTGNLPWHDSVYIRDDWARALGVSIGEEPAGMTTLDQLAAYLRAAIDANPEGSERAVVGLTGEASYVIRQFLCPYNPYFDYCVPVDGVYRLGASIEGTAEGIEQMQRFYQEGLLDPNFYLLDYLEACDAFSVGRAAAFAGDGHAARVADAFKALRANDVNVDDYRAARLVNVLSPDGQYRWPSSYTFWNTVLVSPALADDPEKERRVFAMLDYLATLEGTVEQNSGLRGVEWDLNAAGDPVCLAAQARALSNGCRLIYQVSPSSQDSYQLISPFQTELSAAANEATLTMYRQKMENMADGIPTFIDVCPFFLFSGESKDLYNQIDWEAEIVRIVTDGSLDAETEWNRFIEEKRPLWEPLLAELNAQP